MARENNCFSGMPTPYTSGANLSTTMFAMRRSFFIATVLGSESVSYCAIYHRHGQDDADWARDGAQTKGVLDHLIVISFDSRLSLTTRHLQ